MIATRNATTRANEIRITRVYPVPVALVWDAWTDPDQVGKWWGPRGFTITTHERDLREGGFWRYTMHGPDGVDYPNFTRYHVVEPRSRLVYDHGARSEDAAPMFRVTAEFRDINGSETELDICMTLPTDEAARDTRVFIKAVGGNSTWDRLAEYLEKETTHEDVFVINRSFDAPIERVYAMWTTPDHFAAWLPPTGSTMAFRRVDLREGGDAFWEMLNAQFTMYGRMHWHTLRRPDRIEYSQWFTDAQENLSRHPMAPTWPAKMRTIVTLTPEGDVTTRVTVRWAVDGHATPEEIATFVEAKAGMSMGWTGSFDKLDDVLGIAL